MTDTPPTDAELDEWEKMVSSRPDYMRGTDDEPFLRLIAEVRRLRIAEKDVIRLSQKLLDAVPENGVHWQTRLQYMEAIGRLGVGP